MAPVFATPNAVIAPSQPQVSAVPELLNVKEATPPPVPLISKAERKAMKKAKAKEKKAGEDEFNKALAELSVK